MKKISKESKLFSILVILTLIFLLSINVVYAYFSARASASGEGKFGTLGVNWFYTKNQSYEENIINSGSVLNLNLNADTMNRGVSAGFIYGKGTDSTNDDDVIDFLGFTLEEDSVDVYIRFWLDAYIVLGENPDGTIELGQKNYGENFELMYSGVMAGVGGAEVKSNIVDGETIERNRIYYLPSALTMSSSVTCIDSVKLKEDADIEMLSEKISLTLNFEAVQASNKAYEDVFGDWKGFCNDWS